MICDRLIPIQESVRNGTQCALELLKFDVLKFHNSNEYREMVVTKSQHTVKNYDSNLKSITFDTGYRCCNIFFQQYNATHIIKGLYSNHRRCCCRTKKLFPGGKRRGGGCFDVYFI